MRKTTKEKRRWKLAPGATNPIELPYDGIESPWQIAVDSADNVYVAGYPGKVIKLAAGSNTPAALPFTGLADSLGGIAVDAGGTVYVVSTQYDETYNSAPSTVQALPAGAARSIELNFDERLHSSGGIAVDASGVYVLNSGSTSTQTGYVLLLRRSE